MCHKVLMLCGLALVACGSKKSSAPAIASFKMSPAAASATRQVDPCTNGVMTCSTPTELSIKLTTVYLAADIGSDGANSGETQAIYASPTCDTRSDDDVSQPNLGNCGLDVGLQSSSTPPQTINAAPVYVDLAAGSDAVKTALDAGKFAVKAGTYKAVRVDIGSNAPGAPANGNEEQLAATTARNIRFKAEGMPRAYELRRAIGVDVVFDTPLVVHEGDSVEVDLQYTLTNAVRAAPTIADAAGIEAECTGTPLGTPATTYCLSFDWHLHPVVTVTPAAASH